MASLSISWFGLKNYDFLWFFTVFSKSCGKPSKYKLNQRKQIKPLRIHINQ
jgi:hypothetical protein